MAETYTLYKLIVLYMLDKVDFPLTTSQISFLIRISLDCGCKGRHFFETYNSKSIFFLKKCVY